MELLERWIFNVLHTTSYKEQPLSDKTLSHFRKRCYDYESAVNQREKPAGNYSNFSVIKELKSDDNVLLTPISLNTFLKAQEGYFNL